MQLINRKVLKITDQPGYPLVSNLLHMFINDRTSIRNVDDRVRVLSVMDGLKRNKYILEASPIDQYILLNAFSRTIGNFCRADTSPGIRLNQVRQHASVTSYSQYVHLSSRLFTTSMSGSFHTTIGYGGWTSIYTNFSDHVLICTLVNMGSRFEFWYLNELPLFFAKRISHEGHLFDRYRGSNAVVYNTMHRLRNHLFTNEQFHKNVFSGMKITVHAKSFKTMQGLLQQAKVPTGLEMFSSVQEQQDIVKEAILAGV